jgi:hypothetical protein
MRRLWHLALASSLLAISAPASAGPDTGTRSAGFSGVWMGLKTLFGSGSYTPQPRWVTLFDDGQAFEDLPNDGLLGFDRRASHADPNRAAYWGTWSMQGRAGAIQKPGVLPTKITVEGPDRIKLDSTLFYRCAPVTGLRLAGSWTSYADPSDPGLARQPVGRRPVITFTSDGRFTDDGVFATFLTSRAGEGHARDQAGSGTYRLEDFTLILTYADGRTRHEAFTLLLGGTPAQSLNVVYIRRSRFNRIP